MNLEIGTEYLIEEELKVLCCSCILKPGEIVKIWNQTSKNRLMICKANGAIHKVKRSSLNRTAKEI